MIFNSGSIPHTFSPMVIMTPARAAPMAKPSQFSLATSVDPKAPVRIGIFNGIPATLLSTFTFWNIVRSESASIPSALKSADWMLKSDQSRRKSFKALAVLYPNCTSSG